MNYILLLKIIKSHHTKLFCVKNQKHFESVLSCRLMCDVCGVDSLTQRLRHVDGYRSDKV